MPIPAATWLPILSYADFWDVPRWLLAGGRDHGFWLLESRFDDDADEYSPFFRVKFVGNEPGAARAAFDAGSIAGEAAADELIAVRDIQFDPTVRARLLRRPGQAEPTR
ncbi:MULTISPECIES: hypothetical protein [unclassified Lysobacter]|uniref:hypothetical protein n=1 Tax=unclassified Lysobacter TaxID=2635362 RepID=UPI001BE79274|nr:MULTISPECIES: hypothetical protein [unclassified Lysobacter]MBT2745193.1 hypothetical protein [Lysobacter sp. ISL-42]MBT2751362.1 hypothetical protein [Lysobacter sp. ISL-50]MBT2777304.1 hypothetical protein [Lysobacter sp. ISL-54]MBT2781620.1 hypothetical protein [Lysobacter sp. ISL-52]